MSSPFLRFPTSSVISTFLRSLTQEEAITSLGLEYSTDLAAKLPKLMSTYTMVGSRAVRAEDYGQVLVLAGFTLSPGAADLGNIMGVTGPGSVVTGGGTVALAAGESALLLSDNAGVLTALSVARLRNAIRFSGVGEPAAALEGDEWFNTGTGLNYTRTGGLWVPRAAGVTVSVSPPVGPTDGQQWYDPSDGVLSCWAADSGAWVVVSGPSGAGAESPTVTRISEPAPSATITTQALVDETIYIHAATDKDALTILLPALADSRLGQVKMLIADVGLTNLTVKQAVTMTSPSGLTLTGALSYNSYSYQCVYKSDDYAEWLRIS